MIPFLAYNIISDNQTVALAVGGITYTILITPGYYTGADLLLEIKNALNLLLAATTFSIDLVFSGVTYKTTITVTDSAIPGPAAFTLTTTTIAAVSPSVLSMLGFSSDPLVSAGGVEVSDGALNVVADRYLYVTCDQARGKHGIIDPLSPNTWHEGLVCAIPIAVEVGPGDVISYSPENDSPWVGLVRGSTAGILTFRLARDDYVGMGSPQISWAMELEVHV
jgi:hypothetical protein